jgi:hypothetical protein
MKKQTPLEALRFIVTFLLCTMIFIFSSIYLLGVFSGSAKDAFKKGVVLQGSIIGKKDSRTTFLSNGGATPVNNYYIELNIGGNKELVRISELSYEDNNKFKVGSIIPVAKYNDKYWVIDDVGSKIHTSLLFPALALIIFICIFIWLKKTKKWTQNEVASTDG